ncbi:unnamed protein product [Closterium sp. NIES-65]|nr:unnamed protein product [Closterium sp. NIES-65]
MASLLGSATSQCRVPVQHALTRQPATPNAAGRAAFSRRSLAIRSSVDDSVNGRRSDPSSQEHSPAAAAAAETAGVSRRSVLLAPAASAAAAVALSLGIAATAAPESAQAFGLGACFVGAMELGPFIDPSHFSFSILSTFSALSAFPFFTPFPPFPPSTPFRPLRPSAVSALSALPPRFDRCTDGVLQLEEAQGHWVPQTPPGYFLLVSPSPHFRTPSFPDSPHTSPCLPQSFPTPPAGPKEWLKAQKRKSMQFLLNPLMVSSARLAAAKAEFVGSNLNPLVLSSARVVSAKAEFASSSSLRSLSLHSPFSLQCHGSTTPSELASVQARLQEPSLDSLSSAIHHTVFFPPSLRPIHSFIAEASTTPSELASVQAGVREASLDCLAPGFTPGVELCTFKLILKNAASLLDKNDPALVLGEEALLDLIWSFRQLHGLLDEAQGSDPPPR